MADGNSTGCIIIAIIIISVSIWITPNERSCNSDSISIYHCGFIRSKLLPLRRGRGLRGPLPLSAALVMIFGRGVFLTSVDSLPIELRLLQVFVTQSLVTDLLDRGPVLLSTIAA